MNRIWFDLNSNNEVSACYGGLAEFIVPPEKEYQYYAEISGDIMKSIEDYVYVNGEFRLKTTS